MLLLFFVHQKSDWIYERLFRFVLGGNKVFFLVVWDIEIQKYFNFTAASPVFCHIDMK